MMRLVRFIMLFLGGLFAMAVLRFIMGGLQKGFSGTTSNRQPAPLRPTDITPGGELKKCAACGVYSPAANSVVRHRGGEVLYFCSAECRGKETAARNAA